MRKSFTRIALATAAAASVVLGAASGTSWASPEFVGSFTSAYPAASGSRIANCSLCHTSVPSRNVYGAAWRSAGHNFAAIEGADSDNDGYTNLEEIQALTYPGDANDHPVATGDVTPPDLVTFVIPATSDSLTVPITALAATDDTAVTGYLVRESAATPTDATPGWVMPAPATFTFASEGAKTLHAWAKDAAGNISNGLSDGVTITLVGPPPPPPPPPPDGSLFTEDFSDATGSGDPDWESVSGRFGKARGTFLSLARLRSLSLVSQSVAGLDPLAGGRIQVKVKFINPGRRAQAEVVFDYQDPAHYRYARLDLKLKRLVIGQVGDFGGAVDGTNLSVRLPQLFRRITRWHTLRLDLDPVAGTVSAYVDVAATPALTKSFPLVGIGRLGLAANRARRAVAFDNLAVWDTTVLP